MSFSGKYKSSVVANYAERGCGTGDKIARERMIDNYYDNSNIDKLNTDECLLEERMIKEYGLCKGDYGIDYTTIAKVNGRIDGFAYTSDGKYVNTRTREIVDGFVQKGTGVAHISPYNTNLKNASLFRATAGHEILHVWHDLFISNVKTPFSELAAYKLSYSELRRDPKLQSNAEHLKNWFISPNEEAYRKLPSNNKTIPSFLIP